MNDALQRGSRLGRFEIVRPLGRGSQGSVYLATDTLLGTHVALKLLHPELAARIEVERLHREILVSRRVAHPSVCRVFDVHVEGEWRFISLEYVEGTPLTRVLDGGPLPPARAVELAKRLCEGVAAAHDAGITHRDLKPGNVLVKENDRVVILDFGVATAPDMGRLTSPGILVGTRRYLAPEVWLGLPGTQLADIYALGVILYRCLTGTTPYDIATNAGLDPTQPFEFPPPSAYVETISASLDDVVMRAVALMPGDRFPSARAFHDALAALGDDVVVRPKPPPPPTPPRPPAPATFVLPRRRLQLEEPDDDADHTDVEVPRTDDGSTALVGRVLEARASATLRNVVIAAALVGVLGGAVMWLAMRRPTPAPPVVVATPIAATPPVAPKLEAPLVPQPVDVEPRAPIEPVREPERRVDRRVSMTPSRSVNARELGKALARKGLRRGDAPTIDRLMDGARRGSINDARAAQLAIEAFEFDEGFIDDKLRRFNQRFQGERDPEVRAKVAPMVSLVLSSLQDRRFAEANAHLNDALSTLEGR